MKTILQLIVSFFGIGFVPYAGGTLVTLAAVPIYFLVSLLKADFLAIVLLMAIMQVPLYYFCTKNFHEGKAPPYLAFHRVTGYLAAMTYVKSPYALTIVAAGLVLFLVFERLKPFPIAQAFNLKNGLGITLSSVVSGIYANVILQNLCEFKVLDMLPKFLLH